MSKNMSKSDKPDDKTPKDFEALPPFLVRDIEGNVTTDSGVRPRADANYPGMYAPDMRARMDASGIDFEALAKQAREAKDKGEEPPVFTAHMAEVRAMERADYQKLTKAKNRVVLWLRASMPDDFRTGYHEGREWDDITVFYLSRVVYVDRILQQLSKSKWAWLFKLAASLMGVTDPLDSYSADRPANALTSRVMDWDEANAYAEGRGHKYSSRPKSTNNRSGEGGR